MASLESLNELVQEFLSSERPEVLAIKGEWGIGKTYIWKKLFSSAIEDKKVTLPQYAYVSMFGLNSLEQFKNAIFENIVTPSDASSEANITTYRTNVEKFFRKSSGFMKKTPIAKDFAHAFDSLAFLSLNKLIICIDDLERSGDNLSVKDIMGLASYLKEERNCKIIFLLNEDELSQNDKTYLEYKEKVVDAEVAFQASAEENSELAFNQTTPCRPELIKAAVELKIKNIRILKKIERLFLHIVNLLKDEDNIHAQLLEEIARSVTLFSWCQYSRSSDEVPQVPFVEKSNISLLQIRKETEPLHQKWISLLKKYGHHKSSDLDLLISKGVASGFVEGDIFIEEVLKRNRNIILEHQRESFKSCWDIFHDSFDNNEEEVVNAFIASTNENIAAISLRDFNSILLMLKELSKEEAIPSLISSYLSERKLDNLLPQLKHMKIFSDPICEELSNAIEDITHKTEASLTPQELLEKIATNNDHSQSDIKILASLSSDEFYSLFKETRGDVLYHGVMTCLSFRSYGSPDENYKKIYDATNEALQRIRQESKLNELRMSKFDLISQ